MQINYDRIGSSTLCSILRKAEIVANHLHDAGHFQRSIAVQDLIRSRIAAHRENSRVNKLYREAIAKNDQPAGTNCAGSKEKPAPELSSGAGSSHQILENHS